ncbi:ATPase, V1 complex, subunit C [Neoconidiobolus thromboides FSU 785]|nr:ATPase, V1 complex, subunit C [Neoconidiobolus thromboides FSU 785]
MTLYWLISLPTRVNGNQRSGDKSMALSNLRTLVSEVDPTAGSELASLTLPELKVGTLDSLVILSDELAKYDTTFEGILLKLVDTLRNNLKNGHGNNLGTLKDYLKINNRTVDDYLRSFQWNSMKYRTDKSLKEITTNIQTEVTNLDTQLKHKSTQYQTIRNSMVSYERRMTGNLSVRSLTEVVGPEHSISGSEFLTSVFVAVPNNQVKEWESSYETISTMVVPRSSIKIAEDSEFTLYSAVVFKKVAQEFSKGCRERKFVVRDFEYSEEKNEETKKEIERVTKLEVELWRGLLQWCQVTFGDAFSAWIHIKVLRAFTESVLRYGLPPDYVFSVIKPRNEGKLHKKLIEHYGYLAGSRGGVHDDDNNDSEFASVPGVFDDQNYSPYTHFAFNWNAEESQD